MKHMMGTVLIAGFLVVTADLKAAEKRFERLKSMDGPKAAVVLTTGPRLLAVADLGSPPPAAANDVVIQAPAVDPAREAPTYEAVPPAPLPPVTSPALPSALPLPEAAPPGPFIPGPALSTAPGSLAAGSPPVVLAPAPVLFRKVKYIDRRHIAPGAVPMYVAVRDPCERLDRCSFGPPKCVMVEICVPPCGPPRITCRHDGTKVRYDYGRYAVNITSKHGVVVVNYDR
jgi:hypothetical protein